MDANELAEKIRTLRKSARLSQEELAHEAGVARRAIQRIEKAQGSPTMATLSAIGKVLNIEFVPKEASIPIQTLPEWAATIADRLKSVERRINDGASLRSPSRGYHIDPPEEIGENWAKLSLHRQLLILFLATGDEKYKRLLGQKIISRLEAVLHMAAENRQPQKKAR
jgi:transcriptional regulator with XRE-family HTH domain